MKIISITFPRSTKTYDYVMRKDSVPPVPGQEYKVITGYTGGSPMYVRITVQKVYQVVALPAHVRTSLRIDSEGIMRNAMLTTSEINTLRARKVARQETATAKIKKVKKVKTTTHVEVVKTTTPSRPVQIVRTRGVKEPKEPHKLQKSEKAKNSSLKASQQDTHQTEPKLEQFNVVQWRLESEIKYCEGMIRIINRNLSGIDGTIPSIRAFYEQEIVGYTERLEVAKNKLEKYKEEK